MSKESTETTRLLRVIKDLLSALTEDTATAVAGADSSLHGWELPLARLSGSILRAKIMGGSLDLMNATIDELEEAITLSVAEAAGKIVHARTVTAVPKAGEGALST